MGSSRSIQGPATAVRESGAGPLRLGPSTRPNGAGLCALCDLVRYGRVTGEAAHEDESYARNRRKESHHQARQEAEHGEAEAEVPKRSHAAPRSGRCRTRAQSTPPPERETGPSSHYYGKLAQATRSKARPQLGPRSPRPRLWRITPLAAEPRSIRTQPTIAGPGRWPCPSDLPTGALPTGVLPAPCTHCRVALPALRECAISSGDGLCGGTRVGGTRVGGGARWWWRALVVARVGGGAGVRPCTPLTVRC